MFLTWVIATYAKMRRLGSVQQKMQCVFVIELKDETSRKRESQVSPAAYTAFFDF